jgi:hypothetical protein
MENKDLKFSQMKAAHYIVGGCSLTETADLVGVTSQTLFRWLKLPAMQVLIRELRRITLEHSINELQRLNSKAISTLEKLLDCESSPASRCRAAAIILTKNTDNLETFEYSERLRRIEERFDGENR